MHLFANYAAWMAEGAPMPIMRKPRPLHQEARKCVSRL